MAKKENRFRIHLKCSQCGELNHKNDKKKVNTEINLILRNYCPR